MNRNGVVNVSKFTIKVDVLSIRAEYSVEAGIFKKR